MRASLEKQPNNLDLFFKTVGGDNCNMATLCQIGELNHTYVLSLSFRISFKNKHKCVQKVAKMIVLLISLAA